MGRLSRAEAARLFAGQQARPLSRGRPPGRRDDPDAARPGRSIEPAEAAGLRAGLLKLADELAARGVHRAHIAEIVAGLCCEMSAIGTSRGVDEWLAAERERRTGWPEHLTEAAMAARGKGD